MSLFKMYVCVQEDDRELRCSGCEERSVRAHGAWPSFSSTLHQQQAQQYFDLITDIFAYKTPYFCHTIVPNSWTEDFYYSGFYISYRITFCRQLC